MRFTFETALPHHTPEQVFDWHERPGALERLTPPWGDVEVLHRSGGIEDGGKVSLRVRRGPTSFRWDLRHRDYQYGRQFRDEQVSGPLRSWVHTHSFLPAQGGGDARPGRDRPGASAGRRGGRDRTRLHQGRARASLPLPLSAALHRPGAAPSLPAPTSTEGRHHRGIRSRGKQPEALPDDRGLRGRLARARLQAPRRPVDLLESGGRRARPGLARGGGCRRPSRRYVHRGGRAGRISGNGPSSRAGFAEPSCSRARWPACGTDPGSSCPPRRSASMATRGTACWSSRNRAAAASSRRCAGPGRGPRAPRSARASAW